MGFVGDLFSGSKGAGYTPQGVTGMPDYLQTTNANQLAQGYGHTQSGINQQQAFLNALYKNNIGALGQQNQLANQLAGGQGATNLAQAQLAQNTGNNMREQAALMASARGAGSNPGLIARQAAMAGGAMQQQATGQAATLQAQTALAQQQQLAELNNARLGQLQGGLNSYNQAAQNQYGMGLNAAGNQNQQAIAMQSNINNVGGGIAQGNQGFQSGFLSKLLYKGGQVPGYADGGEVQNGPTSILGRFLQAHSGSQAPSNGVQSLPAANQDYGGGMQLMSKATGIAPGQNDGGLHLMSKGASQLGGLFGGAGGGAADLAGGAGGGAGMGLAAALSPGGKVPGKAEKSGDSEQNDTVDAKLSPGEVVIPRSHVHDPELAAQFLNKLMGWKLKAE